MTIPQLSTELLTQALDSTVPGMIIIDNKNNIIFWNKSIATSSIINKEDALNKNLYSLFPDIQDSRIHTATDLCLKKGSASFISYEFNKKPFPLYVNGDKNKPLLQIIYIKPILHTNNERYCLIQIKDSSTAAYREHQLRKMAYEAKSLSKLKSGFVSSVSHELRTPLTSIFGSLSLLKAGVERPGSKSFQAMLDIAHNNADRLLLLISDILDVEKIESGKMEFNFSSADINELIESCVSHNSGIENKYHVRFDFNSNISLPLVRVDKDRIIQVLNNIMSNAAKFEPHNGIIEIKATLQDNYVRVAVTDHGAGIPEEFKDKIFQAFTQADVSNTKNIAGTGLGLAISKSIVEQHQGIINYESVGNEYTCFYFTVPVYID